MVHSCIVHGCKNRSNKEECKKIKFYTLPFRNERLLQTWLSLICKRRNEVNIHSRICSTHFIGGMKKSDKDVPQIFPWQKSTSMQLPSCEPIAVNPTPRQVVEHDHCYCSSSYRSLCISSVTLGSSFLTTISAILISFVYLFPLLMHLLLPIHLLNYHHFVLSFLLTMTKPYNSTLVLRAFTF